MCTVACCRVCSIYVCIYTSNTLTLYLSPFLFLSRARSLSRARAPSLSCARSPPHTRAQTHAYKWLVAGDPPYNVCMRENSSSAASWEKGNILINLTHFNANVIKRWREDMYTYTHTHTYTRTCMHAYTHTRIKIHAYIHARMRAIAGPGTRDSKCPRRQMVKADGGYGRHVIYDMVINVQMSHRFTFSERGPEWWAEGKCNCSPLSDFLIRVGSIHERMLKLVYVMMQCMYVHIHAHSCTDIFQPHQITPPWNGISQRTRNCRGKIKRNFGKTDEKEMTYVIRRGGGNISVYINDPWQIWCAPTTFHTHKLPRRHTCRYTTKQSVSMWQMNTTCSSSRQIRRSQHCAENTFQKTLSRRDSTRRWDTNWVFVFAANIVENTFHKYIERKHILEGIRIDDETPVEFLGGARVWARQLGHGRYVFGTDLHRMLQQDPSDTHTHTHICIYIYVYIYIHICIYIYTYI